MLRTVSLTSRRLASVSSKVRTIVHSKWSRPDVKSFQHTTKLFFSDKNDENKQTSDEKQPKKTIDDEEDEIDPEAYKASQKYQQTQNQITEFDADAYDEYNEEYQRKNPWKFAFRTFGQLLFMLLGFGLMSYTGYLLVWKRGSAMVYSQAFDKVRENVHVIQLTGDNMKAFGRDSGGRKEGRRNLPDEYEYEEPLDNSSRLRIRFTVRGVKGQVKVYAEISNKMGRDEFVYLICQDMRTGRVVTIEDNRDKLEQTYQSSSSSSSSSNPLTGIFDKLPKIA